MGKHTITLMGFGLLLLVMITAVVVAAQSPSSGLMVSQTIYDPSPQTVSANTSKALDRVFESINYDWPPAGQQTVPPLMLTQLPDDFGKVLQPNQRRELFLRALLPLVLIENRRLQEQRELANWLLEDDLPAEGSAMHTWLTTLAKQFRVRGNLQKQEARQKLLIRLDVIPPALALAQAAIETGWGSSRFALEGNSLFGQWSFVKGSGLKPNQRDADATHLVASFPNLRASVRAYMRNLNTGRAYHEFRTARAQARKTGQALRANDLAEHLHRYSQRGEAYVADLRRIIRSPSIARLTEASLARVNPAQSATLNTRTKTEPLGS
ncbi:MAG: glucosaminidase domain-containing protein [Ectothiorhodospiraceae bacterium]|nr:glucosaminidase domain-containing protein [Ectothiorhodospiraceae bacterium]